MAMRREMGWLIGIVAIVALMALYGQRDPKPESAVSPTATRTVTSRPSASPVAAGPDAIPPAWYALARGHRPREVHFLSVCPGYAAIVLRLTAEGTYRMNLETDAVVPDKPEGEELSRGRFELNAAGRRLTLHRSGQADLVFRIEKDEKGPLLWVERGDLGTTDPYVTLPLSFDGRPKGKLPPTL